MKILEILGEENRRTSTADFGLDDLENLCPIAWNFFDKNENIPLYRGIRGGGYNAAHRMGDVLQGDSSKMKRKSANTTNHYTTLF